VSLARELFGIHSIRATPENFRKFFDHYAFCPDHVMRESDGAACHGVQHFIRDLLALPSPPVLACSPAISGSARKSSCGISGFGKFFISADLRMTMKTEITSRSRRSSADGALSENNLQPEEIISWATRQFDIRCGKFIGARVLAVATGGAKHHELKTHSPDWLVENLTQISAREIW